MPSYCAFAADAMMRHLLACPLTHLFLSFFNDSTVIEMHNDSKRWQTRHLVAINIKQTISVQTVQLNDGHPGGRKWVGGSMGRWERQKIVT